MKAALVLEGGALFPDQAKAKRLGVRRFYWEADDPNLEIRTDPKTGNVLNVLKDMRLAGWERGLMRDPIWEKYSELPEVWAQRFSDDLYHLKVGLSEQCALMADIETHDEAYVYFALKALRRLRGGRGVVWAPESFQAGWMSDRLIDLINTDQLLTIAPQSYRGDMTPRATDSAMRDLLRRGVGLDNISGFYPCATVGPDKNAKGELVRRYTNPPDDWDGFLYDFANVLG